MFDPWVLFSTLVGLVQDKQVVCLSRKEFIPLVFMEDRGWPPGLSSCAVEGAALSPLLFFNQMWPGRLGKIFWRVQKSKLWWSVCMETNYFHDVFFFFFSSLFCGCTHAHTYTHARTNMWMHLYLLLWKISDL